MAIYKGFRKLIKTINDLVNDDGSGSSRGVVVNVNPQGHGIQTIPMPVQTQHPGLYAFPEQSVLDYEPVPLNITFAPLDEETEDYLDGQQPVVVLIFDQDDPSETIVLQTELGQGLTGAMYPGNYGLIALVYVDEDIEEIDGAGIADFDVEAGEPPFDLSVSITADEDDIAELLGID